MNTYKLQGKKDGFGCNSEKTPSNSPNRKGQKYRVDPIVRFIGRPIPEKHMIKIFKYLHQAIQIIFTLATNLKPQHMNTKCVFPGFNSPKRYNTTMRIITFFCFQK